MKTQEQLTERLDLIQAGLHLHDDDLSGYFIGQITALLWALNRYPCWIDCHMAADVTWEDSRIERKEFLK